MAAQSITDSLIKKLKPEEKQYDIRDTQARGFMLRVYPSGLKTYLVEYARGKKYSICEANDKNKPGEIREIARKIRSDYKLHGKTPQEEIKKEYRDSLTFKKFFDTEFFPWYAARYQSTASCLKGSIEKHFPFLSGLPLNQVDAKKVEKWKTYVLTGRDPNNPERMILKSTELLKPNTVNKCIYYLRSVLGYAVKQGYLTTNPFTDIEMEAYNDERVRYLSGDEEKALQNALLNRNRKFRAKRESGNDWRKARHKETMSPYKSNEFIDHLEPIIIVALNTGLRKQELLKLKKSQVDFKAKSIKVVGKGRGNKKKIRQVPLNDHAYDILTRWIKQAPESIYVFPSVRDAKKPLTDIKKAFAGLMTDAGIDDFTFHDLRHDFASKLVMAGVPLNTVRVLLGHSTIELTMRYAHLAEEHTASAVSKLQTI